MWICVILSVCVYQSKSVSVSISECVCIYVCNCVRLKLTDSILSRVLWLRQNVCIFSLLCHRLRPSLWAAADEQQAETPDVNPKDVSSWTLVNLSALHAVTLATVQGCQVLLQNKHKANGTKKETLCKRACSSPTQTCVHGAFSTHALTFGWISVFSERDTVVKNETNPIQVLRNTKTDKTSSNADNPHHFLWQFLEGLVCFLASRDEDDVLDHQRNRVAHGGRKGGR